MLYLNTSTPLAIDLCCGRGGWTHGLQAAGFHVVGFDIVRHKDYPGDLVIQDVRTLNGSQLRHARLIVASPPCQEFSRHDMPQTRAKNPPEPDLSICVAAWRIRTEAGVPMVIENVRGSKRWLEPILGPARRVGSFYLYGDTPVLLPTLYALGAKGLKKRQSRDLRPGEYRGKELMSHNAAARAVIPYELARWVGEVYVNPGAGQ